MAVRQRSQPTWGCALLVVASLAGGCAGSGTTPTATSQPWPIPLPTCPAEPVSHQDALRLFEGDRTGPFDVEERSMRVEDGATVHDIMYSGADGGRHQANLVIPSHDGRLGGVMYLHGAGGSPSDFVPEALELARRGVASLLITQPEMNDAPVDRCAAISEIAYEMREMERALDLLASRPEVDPARLGYVGFSFGAVRGATFAGFVGPRLRIAILASLPPSYGAPWMEPFDPVAWVPYVSPAALYVQEGSQDPWFTREEAEAIISAAGEPKHLVWYEAGHSLGDQSYRDRLDWLAEALGSG
jgi:predicted esterase